MKKVKLTEEVNDTINELTAQYLEDLCKLLGHDIYITDTDWQTVYDLKSVVLVEYVEQLGLIVED